jgi:hypothetical protein
MTRGFFEREYISAGKTLRQISAETGYPCKFLAECARAHGVTPASASDPAPIDPDWLRDSTPPACAPGTASQPNSASRS